MGGLQLLSPTLKACKLLKRGISMSGGMLTRPSIFMGGYIHEGAAVIVPCIEGMQTSEKGNSMSGDMLTSGETSLYIHGGIYS